MDTTERMMIMGMCLQGLLANPLYSHGAGPDSHAAAVAANIRLAHQYADALDPPPTVTAAQKIAALTRIAYAAVVAADADGAGAWRSYDTVRHSGDADELDDLDGVFERVSRWFHDPAGYPETMQDRIIAAVVAAGRGQDDAPQPDLFD